MGFIENFCDKHIKKRRFLQPLRGLRRIFRRKGRPVISTPSNGNADAVSTLPLRSDKEYYDARRDRDDEVETSNLEPSKSHSTSQLIEDQIDNSHRRSLQSTLLSVSHDSVFTSEQRSADSGSETSLCVHSHTRLGFPHSSVRAELFEAVRRRRVQENNVSDDEDLGLPRSPVSNSPTTAEDMFTKENIVTKSSQSTCSDGSLLSMGSSVIDEESYCQSSRHSSKLSLYEKRASTGSDTQHNDRSTSSSGNGSDASSLSHSAAKHKMAVKPKRNHGAPHKKRQLISSITLPTTPELNEENGSKSVAAPLSSSVADTRHSDEHQSNQNSNRCDDDAVDTHHHHHRVSNVRQAARAAKSSSLPSNKKSFVSPASSFRQLGRSGSNATKPSSSSPSPLSPDDPLYDDVAADEKNSVAGKRADGGASFFSRLLLRRSSKKKKTTIEETELSREDATVDDSEQTASLSYVEEEEEGQRRQQQHESAASYVNGGLNAAMKHHPMFRQRVEPLNLPTTLALEPMYASTVPVNMETSRMHKSHSFRTENSDKLPLTNSREEATPSLPVNVGLVTATLDDHRELSTRSTSQPKENAPMAGQSNDCGPSKMRPTTPEYENVSSPLNTLNINVNETSEADAVAGEEWETKLKLQQVTDVKIPIPAPRTSLLLKTSSIGRLNDVNDDGEKIVCDNPSVVVAGSDVAVDESTSLNVTITEIDDGQKSIISISSRPSVASDADPFEPTTPPARPESVVTVHSLSDGECADDVFLPVLESTRRDLTETNDETTYKTAPSNQSTTSADAKPELMTIPKQGSSPNLPEPVSKPSVLRTKPERLRLRLSACGQKSDKPLGVVIPDPQTGTVKVNDTVVVMRKKSRPERELCPAKSGNDDEPELMKVFARRSLKLKESDSVEEMLLEGAKSRDSDKENEDSNTTPSPERTTKRKDEQPDPTPRLPFGKFQRSVSHDVVVLSSATSNEIERRQRCKSTPNEREPESDGETKSETNNVMVEERTSTPFKRIQQRREEWEKRAQQAMKVHGAK